MGISKPHSFACFVASFCFACQSALGCTLDWTANCLNQYTEFTHDADGNMTQCGDWTYTYDAANRLKKVSSNGVLIVTNFYDAKSRRVKKVTPEATTAFFYDGWNLVEERIAYTNGTYSTIRYFWGKDLSGTLQGAGGVGGLLYVKHNGAIYVPHADAMGNILLYTDTAGNVVAEYSYGLFGNIIAQTGPLADQFRIRYSTKYLDHETGLYYYGYRHYSPMLMRWLNRDTIEAEKGGFNLYSFCLDSPLLFYDSDGRLPSLNWGGYIIPENGRFSDALDDFVNGGASKTYQYLYPDSATERLMDHPAIKPIFDKYANIRCGTSRRESGSISYSAGAGQFLDDVMTFGGKFDSVGRLSRKNGMEGDVGHEILGSFTGKYTLSVDCERCMKSLDVEIVNDMTMASATRIPGTSFSLISYPLLKPVRTIFTYLIVERIGK